MQTVRTSHWDGSWLRGSLKPRFLLIVLTQDRRVTLSLGALAMWPWCAFLSPASHESHSLYRA